MASARARRHRTGQYDVGHPYYEISQFRFHELRDLAIGPLIPVIVFRIARSRNSENQNYEIS